MPSSYLDDMSAPAGTSVECVSNISSPGFSVGIVYQVTPGGFVRDDYGQIVRPSARFRPVNPPPQKGGRDG